MKHGELARKDAAESLRRYRERMAPVWKSAPKHPCVTPDPAVRRSREPGEDDGPVEEGVSS